MSLLNQLPISRSFQGKKPNDYLVSKACGDPNSIDTVSLPNSLLQPEQSNRFIDLLVDESRLLKAIRVERVNNCSGKVHKLDLCKIVTEGACTTSCPISSVPEEATMDWNTEKYRATFSITSDFLECNIERGAARDTILNMFTKRMNMDMELAAIQGDEDLGTGDNQPRINNLLGVNDGFGKLLKDCTPDCQIVDAAGASPSRYLYYEMKRRIPSRYRGGLNSYRFISPPSAQDHWDLEWMRRETPSGDAAINGASNASPLGIPFFTAPLMPEDIPYTGGANPVDSYELWLTPLQNLVAFIQRDITIEFERVPRLDRWEVTVHYKMDFEVENPDLVVMAKNVSNCGSAFTDCGCETCEVC